MGGRWQAVSSELWSSAKREDESTEGRKEMGDRRVAAAQNCSKGKVIRNFTAKHFLSFFVRIFCRKWPISVKSQLQNAIRELTNLLFAHFSFVGEEKSAWKISESQIADRSVQSNGFIFESWYAESF